jgi:hypothetical protein
MPNQSPNIAPPTALTVTATLMPAFPTDFESSGAPLNPPACRVNYVVRNLGPTECGEFEVVLLVGDRLLDRHRYTVRLDVGRALASYFRVSTPVLEDRWSTLLVRIEQPSGVTTAEAVVSS